MTDLTSDGECEECGGAVDSDGDTKGECAANGGPNDPCLSCYACSCDGSC